MYVNGKNEEGNTRTISQKHQQAHPSSFVVASLGVSFSTTSCTVK